MALQKYNPKRITGSFTGSVGGRDFAVKFTAFMDDSFIKAQYNEDRVTRHDGAQGDTTFVLNANTGAKAMATFSQGSATNAELDKLVPDAKRNYMPVGVLTFEDLNGTCEIKSPAAVIAISAAVEFSNKVTGREWTFELTDAEIRVGSAGDF